MSSDRDAGTGTRGDRGQLILASAGSGKTFQISSRYIGLLARGEPPETILASTFTRKAAGEILDRVLERLAQASLAAREAAELARHTGLAAGPASRGQGRDAVPSARDTRRGDPAAPGSELGTVGPATPEFWRKRLRYLLRRLERVEVATLDAFFVRAVRSYGHELGLPPGWQIADEAAARRLQAEAVDRVLREMGEREAVELLRAVNRGGTHRSVHRILLEMAADLQSIHRELDRDGGAAWDAMAREAPTGAGGEDGPEELAAAIEALEEPLTGSGRPNRNWQKANEKAARALRARDWRGFLEKGIGAAVLSEASGAEPATYYGREIPSRTRALYERGLELARRRLARELAAEARALGRLAGRFERALSRRQREEGAYRFRDVTHLAAGLADPGTGDASETRGESEMGDDAGTEDDARRPLAGRRDLSYRLDALTRHLLLDEFQDTSVPQWRALAPLAERTLGGARAAPGEARDATPRPGDDAGDGGTRQPDSPGSLLVVADPKQSIYGWRDADPTLVRHVARLHELQRRSLRKNWRSSPVVLEAVNRVFRDIASSEVVGDEHRDTVREWARDFEPHHAAHDDRPGYARLEAGPRDPGRGSDNPRLLRYAARRVAELRRRAPEFEIGVLVRRNRTVARMVLELRDLEVPASEEGGTPLTDSAPAAGLLALLRLADHPADTIARYHVARTPVGRLVELTDHTDDRAARRLARRVRDRLVRDGYGGAMNEWFRRLAPRCDPRQRRRLSQLVELGFRWEERATLRPTDFVRFVEDERTEDPASAPVRVMTVHQAKGLEFDVVLLPELEGSMLRGGGATALPVREETGGPVTRVYPGAPGSMARAFPGLLEAYREHRRTRIRDELSALYVAMTRARHALHLLVAADGDRGPGSATSHARLLREALASGVPAVDGETLWEHGDPDWRESVPREERERRRRAGAVHRGEPEEVDVGLRPDPARRGRILPRRTPSDLEEGEGVDLAERLRLDADPARRKGIVVHAWCRRIRWIEDGMPDEAALERAARQAVPSVEARKLPSLMDEFRGWLGSPDVREALSRDAYPEAEDVRVAVERELPYAHRDGDAVAEGVMDRLVEVREGDRVARLEVLDFKTGHRGAEPGELEAAARRYRPQMEAYRRAAAALYGVEASRVAAKLVFLEAGAVREV